jgi:hypothetical protein
MNGAEIPAILWFLVTFAPETPAMPIQLYGPIEHEECMKLEQQQVGQSDSWCQRIVIRKPEEKK